MLLNMYSTENGWLEDYCPFEMVLLEVFFFRCVRGVGQHVHNEAFGCLGRDGKCITYMDPIYGIYGYVNLDT